MDADISIGNGNSNGSGNGGPRSNSTTTTTSTTATTAPTNPTTASARPVLPQRSKSTLTAPPPADAIKPDDMAVADVYQQVDQLGSLEAAARKLSRYAKKQAWEDDPEEREYLASNTKLSGLEANSGTGTGTGTGTGISAGKEDKGLEAATGKMTLAQQRMMQAFQDEQDGDEGAGMQVDEEDYEVFADDDDDDDDDDDNDGNHEVVHLQEVEDGLWIGDLVAAMDTAGLQARGIVSVSAEHEAHYCSS
jgi:dual specificity phosphatase 12